MYSKKEFCPRGGGHKHPSRAICRTEALATCEVPRDFERKGLFLSHHFPAYGTVQQEMCTKYSGRVYISI